MKNFTKLLLGVGMLSVATMAQAQKRVVASLGFEEGDAKYNHEVYENYSLTTNIGEVYGDWVNVQGGDDWSELYSGDAHSGEYCFRANNGGDSDSYSWNRGFKIMLPNVEPQKAYRVSFWLKASPTYMNAEGVDANKKLNSWLSKGMENFDIACMDINGSNFGFEGLTDYTGNWTKYTFQVFTPTREQIKSVVDGRSWVGNANWPGGGGTYKEYWGGEIPEMYFFIANMYSPGEYLLDDILVEENVYVKQTYFNLESCKIDFGWKTNIAELAKANNGTLVVDPSLATVTLNGEEIEVEFIEGKEDGYLYIFPADATFNDADDVRVSFKGDNRILYTNKVRPSADTEGDVAVLGCEDEVAIYDEYAVEAAAWSNPIIESSTPSNYEFGINSADLKQIVVNFTASVDISKATATLSLGSKSQNVDMTLSDNGKTITIPVSGLSEGEWVLSINGLINSLGMPATAPTTLTFTIGEGSEGGVTVVYKSDFASWDINMLPLGWSGHSDEADDRIGSLTDTFSGAPRLMGTSDAPSHGIYIAQRGGSEGVLAFGKYAAQGSIGDQLADGVTDAEALYLEEGEWQLSYRMATWQGLDAGKKYTCTIYNALGEAVYSIDEQSPESNVADANEESIVNEQTYEFSVPADGFYYVEYVTKSGWRGLILTDFAVQSKPSSSAAYYKQMLEKAISDAENVLAGATDEYNGETKTAFEEALERAKTGTFTSPAAIEAVVKELNTKSQKLVDRISNYKNFVNGFASAQSSYDNLADKYKQSDIAKNVEALIAEYGAVDPTTLSDAELASLATQVKTLSGQISNVQTIVNTVTYQAQKAVAMATALNVFTPEYDAADALASDDSAVIDALNRQNTGAFYDAVSKNDYLDALDYQVIYRNSSKYYTEEIPAGKEDEYSEDGYEVATKGVSMEAFVKNPKFYTTLKEGNFNNGTDDLPGWTIEQGSEENGQFAGTVHYTGTAPSESMPVSNVMINNYFSSDYRISQTITNLPVGVYDFRLDTRTFGDAEGEYNAQNELGVWDKYIFVQVDDEAPAMAPFEVGGYQQVRVTVVKGIEVKEGSKVTIGVVENYTSGLAMKNGESTNGWDTNTWVDDANLYFVAPLAGYDYAAAAAQYATDITTVNAQRNAVEGVYGINGVKVSSLQKGVNIVKMSNGDVKKVIK